MANHYKRLEKPILSSERKDAFTRHPSIGKLSFLAPIQICSQTQFGGKLAVHAIKGDVRFLHRINSVVSAN
jgi:hypothetical protein